MARDAVAGFREIRAARDECAVGGRRLRGMRGRAPPTSADSASNDARSVFRFRVRCRMMFPSPQAVFSWLPTGSLRSRVPVAAKIAFDSAAAVAAVPGSPIPPGASPLFTRWTSIGGTSLMRIIR